MKKLVALAPVLVLTIVFCAVNGCGEKVSETVAERQIEKAMAEDGTEADVKIDSDTGSMTVKSKDGDEDVEIKMDGTGMTIKSKDGETVSTYSADGETYTMTTEGGGPSVAVGKGAKLPEGFPKDVPVYAGVEIQMTSADPASKSFSVQGISSDAADKVAEFYKKEMPSQGWTETDGMVQTGANPMHMLNFEKGESTAVIIAMLQDGKTSLSISIGAN